MERFEIVETHFKGWSSLLLWKAWNRQYIYGLLILQQEKQKESLTRTIALKGCVYNVHSKTKLWNDKRKMLKRKNTASTLNSLLTFARLTVVVSLSAPRALRRLCWVAPPAITLTLSFLQRRIKQQNMMVMMMNDRKKEDDEYKSAQQAPPPSPSRIHPRLQTPPSPVRTVQISC